jgi:hypothetical protein
MVFYVRSRRAYDELLQLLGDSPSPLWVERDVLTNEELFRLREEGRDVTNFTIEPGPEPELSIIRMHHPDQVIWVES